MKLPLLFISAIVVCLTIYPCQTPSAATFNYSSNPNALIPDDCNPGPASDVIVVSDSGTIADVVVEFESDHTWVGDLTIELTSPAGTVVELMNRTGIPKPATPCDGCCGCPENMGGAGYPLIFDDDAGTGVEHRTCSTPFNGTVAPFEPLSAFDGEEMNGSWTITAYDGAGADTGNLIAWRLQILIPSDCCEANGTPGCDNTACEDVVCHENNDPSCCTDGGWDEDCAALARDLCPVCEACCFPDGSCSALAEADCNSFGGAPGGADSNCDPNLCPQPEACCFSDGSCSDLLEADCTGAGGAPGGASTDCATTDCPVETSGDCCFDNGTPGCEDPVCEESVCITDPFCCGDQGGFWDSLCASSALADPNCNCLEACCFADGSCSDLLAADCSTAGGTPQGAGTDCATTDCSGGSDCCIDNGTPGCDDPDCQEAVCAYDPFCCASVWDSLCAEEAATDPNCDCSLIQCTVTADAGLDVAICDGETTTLDASGSTGTGTLKYSWSPTTGLSNPLGVSTDAAPTESTTYTIVVTAVGGCTDSEEVTVTVCDNPEADAGEDQAVCAGDTATLGPGDVPSGNYTYSWTPDDGSLDDPTLANPTASTSVTSPSTSETYTVVMTELDCNSCTDSAQMVLTINALPDCTVIVDNGNLVDGDLVEPGSTHTAQVPDAGAGASYVWEVTGATIVSGQGTNEITWKAPDVPAGIKIKVTVTDVNGCVCVYDPPFQVLKVYRYIPALGGWGLIGLAALIAGAGAWIVRRRKRR